MFLVITRFLSFSTPFPAFCWKPERKRETRVDKDLICNKECFVYSFMITFYSFIFIYHSLSSFPLVSHLSLSIFFPQIFPHCLSFLCIIISLLDAFSCSHSHTFSPLWFFPGIVFSKYKYSYYYIYIHDSSMSYSVCECSMKELELFRSR